MASDFRPTGVFVPLVTPFTEDGAVDSSALEALARDVLDAGAAGVVALATTGEPTSLTDSERDATVAVCAQVCGERGATLIVGAGTDRFVEMIECGLAGRLEEGRGHAEALLPLVRALFAEPTPAPIKAVLHAHGRIATPHVRMPLADASPPIAERAVAAAREAGAPSAARRPVP